MKLPLFIMLLAVPQGAWAYSCNSIGWNGGDADVNVNVSPDVNTGRNKIVDLRSQISCKNDSVDGGWVDSMWLASNGMSLNSAIFKDLKGGVIISGKVYPEPVPEVEIFSLNAQETKSLPVELYFELTSMGKSLQIRRGDRLAQIKFIQRNNHGAQNYYIWYFIAANDVDINTSTCKILSGETLLVELGELERSEIQSSGTSAQTVEKSLNITCDVTHEVDFQVKMNTTLTSWNNNAITTSNNNLGVVMRWNGNIVTNGNTQQLSVVNGSISVPLSFTPVKPTSVSYEDIKTGAFNASATLIITQQ